MNSAPISFRDELRRFPEQHPAFRSVHPFWQDCFRGRLTRHDLQLWAVNIYPVIRDFSRLYITVGGKCESETTLTFLSETIFEETGSGVAAESHPTLFRNFMAALGIAESDIPASGGGQGAGREVWEYCWRTVRGGSFLEGLTLVGLGIERPLPTFFQMLARCFQNHYGISAEAVKYFAVHTVADVKHSQLAARIVSEIAQTSAQQASVRNVLVALWDLHLKQLDELYRAVQERRQPASPVSAAKGVPAGV